MAQGLESRGAQGDRPGRHARVPIGAGSTGSGSTTPGSLPGTLPAMAVVLALVFSVVLGPPFGKAEARALDVDAGMTIEVSVELDGGRSAVLARVVAFAGELPAVAEEDQPVNVFEAIGNGAMTGMQVAFSVGAMLVAFVALIALINGVLSGVGSWFGMEGLTLQWLLGKAFAPLAFLIGVPWSEAAAAGSLIGQKLVINEFYAYVSFVGVKETLSAHTQLVVTFALCGFANLSSIAILLGGLGAVVPERRSDIARLGLRAVIGGTLANLMNASLAGLFFALQAA